MADSNTGEALLAFVVGAIAGAAAALLLAPASGRETRDRLEGWLKEGGEKGSDFLRSKKESLTTQKEALTAAFEAGKKAYREAGQG